jgi:hypothetical protein
MTTLEVSRVVFADKSNIHDDALVKFARLTELRIGDRIYVTGVIHRVRRKFDIWAIYDISPNGLSKVVPLAAKCADEFRGEKPSDAKLSEGHLQILDFVFMRLLEVCLDAARDFPSDYPEFVVGLKRWFRGYVLTMLQYMKGSLEKEETLR